MKTLAHLLSLAKTLDVGGTLTSQFCFDGLNEHNGEYVLSFTYEEDDNIYSYKCTSEQVENAVRNKDGAGWIVACNGEDWEEELNIIPFALVELK